MTDTQPNYHELKLQRMKAEADVASCITELARRISELSDKELLNIEAGIYNWTIEYAEKNLIANVWQDPEFRNTYRMKAKSVIDNLDASSYIGNEQLLNRMRAEEFKPEEIAFKSCEEIYPEMWKEQLCAKFKMEDALKSEKQMCTTDQFKCGKCKQKNCTYYELQIRSADEPATMFITCQNCNNKWRMG